MRDPIRVAGTFVAAAICTLGLAPSAGAVSTSADHATVVTAPAGADVGARYWKCRWPSYRNAHPWRCSRHFDEPRDRGDDGRDNGHHGGDGGGRDHGGSHDDHHGPGWTGAVTGHPGPRDH